MPYRQHFYERAVSGESQPLVNPYRSSVGLCHVQKDVTEATPKQLGYDGAGRSGTVSTAPVRLVGVDVADGTHTISWADEMGASCSHKLSPVVYAVKDSSGHLCGSESVSAGLRVKSR
jgi:hypothetical protein